MLLLTIQSYLFCLAGLYELVHENETNQRHCQFEQCTDEEWAVVAAPFFR